MSSFGPLGRPDQRLAKAVEQCELALDDVHDEELAQTLETNKDQIERVRVELVRRKEGSR